MTAPSEIPRGREWIDNFDPEDRAIARILLDSVRFVPIGIVLTGLKSRLLELHTDGKIRGPALLVSAISMEDLTSASGARGDEVTEMPTSPASPVPTKTAYVDFDPGQDIPSTPGSEAFTGSLIRDMTTPARADAAWVAPNAGLDELRRRKISSIVILTDYVGSGTQLREYAKLFTRNPTIRSWRSMKKIEIHAVAYGASTGSDTLLHLEHSPIDHLWAVETAPSIASMGWAPDVRASVERICRHYADQKSRSFGFKGSGGLLVTSTSVPNNLPQILKQQRRNWAPFFEGRHVPPDISRALGDYTPAASLSDVLLQAGQPRLSRQVDTVRREETKDLLTVLALLRRTRSDIELGAAIGRPLPHIEQLLSALRSLGLTDEHRRPTEAGDAALGTARRASRRVTAGLKGADTPYYPSSLR